MMIEGRHEQFLVYCMVARGEVILAEYSPFSAAACAAFSSLASRTSALISLSSARPPSSSDVAAAAAAAGANSLLSFNFDDTHTYNFIVEDQFRYAVVSSDLSERKIAFLCLQRIKSDFNKHYMGRVAEDVESLAKHALQQEFRPRLKVHMEYCLDHYQKLEKLPSVRDQVQELKESVLENIKQVHESQLKLEIDDVEVLHAQVDNFHRQGKKLRRKMWMKQARVKLVALLACLIVAFIIWLGVCKGLEC